MTSIDGELVVEQPGHRRPGQAVGLLLELVDRVEVALEVLHPVELAQCGRQLAALAVEDGREPSRLGRRLLDAVDDERLGDGLDAVHDVVEPRDELVDVLAIERRDERVLEPAGDLVVDLVAALLERLDVGDARLELVVLLDHLVERRRRRGQVVAVER